MTIVVVDDTADHLELLAEFIGELRPNATVCLLRNGLELPTCLESKPVDLVLMDLMMPSINGYDLVRKVRGAGRWSDLPIVAVTGLRRSDHHESLQEAGFSDCISKPYEIEELARVLDQLLPRNNSSSAAAERILQDA